MVIDYFRTVFQHGSPDLDAQTVVLQSVQPKVTNSMNVGLIAPFTMEEVKVALFQMHPSKAPGPDGMSPYFFQNIGTWAGFWVSSYPFSFYQRDAL